MDLFSNPKSRFTKWAVENRILTSPFVLYDVGVQGGIAPRWDAVRPKLAVYGFDPLEEKITPLRNNDSGDIFMPIALGNEDGTRTLHIPDIAFAASFYERMDDGLVGTEPLIPKTSRVVEIRRIDSLISDGKLIPPDFIKIDCEGFEPEVLDGATNLLHSAPPLALECETTFSPAHGSKDPHFVELYKRLGPFGFTLCDLAFSRTPQRSYTVRAKELRRFIVHRTLVAQPDVFNVLFFRRLDEGASAREVVKQAMIFELYGLRDSAFDLLQMHKKAFKGTAVATEGADLLVKWAGYIRHLVPVRPTRI